MTITYNNPTFNVNPQFTLFNEFGQNYKQIIDNLHDIGRNAKRLLKHIAFREYRDGFASEYQKGIAKHVGVTDRTIRRLTKILIEKNYIRIRIPELNERRSGNKKIIYKIIPDRFRKKTKMSGEMSGENPERTFNKNKEIKYPDPGSFFSEKFIKKKIRKGYDPDIIKTAIESCEKYKSRIRNPYSYFNTILKRQRQKHNENEEIKKHRERKERELNLYAAQTQKEPYYHNGTLIKPDIQPVSLSNSLLSALNNLKKGS